MDRPKHESENNYCHNSICSVHQTPPSCSPSLLLACMVTRATVRTFSSSAWRTLRETPCLATIQIYYDLEYRKNALRGSVNVCISRSLFLLSQPVPYRLCYLWKVYCQWGLACNASDIQIVHTLIRQIPRTTQKLMRMVTDALTRSLIRI